MTSGWFKINALTSTRAEVLIFGEIGWDVRAADFAKSLAEVDAEELTVRVNSPGGDVYEGLAIMNALRGHPATVTTIVEGLAASAASVIAIGGGDRVICRPNGELMIHEAWTMSQGNAGELEKTVADLNRVSANLAEIYASKAGTDADMWRSAMKAETWFSANEALEAGLVDEVVDARETKAALVGTFNMAKFKHAGRSDAPAPTVLPAGNETEGMTVAFKNDIANKLGLKGAADEATVLRALDEVLAEQTGEINVKVELTYPEDVDVTPTGKATVEPSSEVPEGVAFAVGDVAEGWTAEVDEATGVLTLVAPEGAVGDTAEFVVTATGGEESAEFTVTAAIVAASEEKPDESAPADDTVTLDKGVYEALLARADKGDRADAEGAKRAAVALVDDAVRSGKVLAVKRDALVSRAVEDYDGMKFYFSKLASGVVPVAEKGRGGSDADHDHDDEAAERERLVAIHRARGGFTGQLH